MISKEFFQALEDLRKEKRIEPQVFIDALETALTSAYKKQYEEAKNAQVKLNPEKHTIKIYSYKNVVDTVEDPDKEISLKDAQLIKKSYKVGDVIETEETPKEFGRIAAQTAKQVVMQKLREAERTITAQELAEKEEQIISTIIRRIEGTNIFVEIGNNDIEAVMGEKDQIPGERYTIGQRIKVFVKKIKEGTKGPLLQVSRSLPGFVQRLLELEIPEIQSGEVVVDSIAREAGYRTKIAVHSTNPDIDVIGACIGNKGMRINSVINELNGEKIDVIEFSDIPEVYVQRALSPAPITSVTLCEDGKYRAIVPDDKLSLAIGKGGHNVRLAVKLTGLKIDVKPESSQGVELEDNMNNVQEENKPYDFADDDLDAMFDEEV